jgi:hypothetical protein
MTRGHTPIGFARLINAFPIMLAAILLFYRNQSSLPPFYGSWYGSVAAAFTNGQSGFLVHPFLIQAWAIVVALGFMSALALSSVESEETTSKLRHTHLIARHVYIWVLACAIPYWAVPLSLVLPIAIPGLLALSLYAIGLLAACRMKNLPMSGTKFRKETRYAGWWVLALLALETGGTVLIGGS